MRSRNSFGSPPNTGAPERPGFAKKVSQHYSQADGCEPVIAFLWNLPSLRLECGVELSAPTWTAGNEATAATNSDLNSATSKEDLVIGNTSASSAASRHRSLRARNGWPGSTLRPHPRFGRTGAAIAGLALGLALTAPVPATAAAQPEAARPSGVPAYDHIVVVVEENHAPDQV